MALPSSTKRPRLTERTLFNTPTGLYPYSLHRRSMYEDLQNAAPHFTSSSRPAVLLDPFVPTHRIRPPTSISILLPTLLTSSHLNSATHLRVIKADNFANSKTSAVIEAGVDMASSDFALLHVVSIRFLFVDRVTYSYTRKRCCPGARSWDGGGKSANWDDRGKYRLKIHFGGKVRFE